MSVNLPGAYWFWLSGLAWTSIGTSVLSFGLVWTATGRSAVLGGLVLTMVIVPRVVLMLVGGSVADRMGAGRIMIATDAAMCVLMAAVAAITATGHSPTWLLLSAALAMGIADSFYLPASGTVPRILVPDEALQQAMGGRQLVTQTAAFAGPVAGGLIVSRAGLDVSFAAGAAGFLGMLVILLMLRRRLPDAAVATGSPGVLEHLGAGLRVIGKRPALVAALSLTTAFAAFILPLTSLLVPLLARSQGWEADQAGVLSGLYGVSLALVAGWVMLRGGFARAGLAAGWGIIAAGTGVVLLGAVPYSAAAAAGLALAGLGTGVFSTHLGPVFLSAAPHEYLSRVQSVLILAQSAPLLIANPAIGLLSENLGARSVILFWGAGSLAAGAVALVAPAMRAMQRQETSSISGQSRSQTQLKSP